MSEGSSDQRKTVISSSNTGLTSAEQQRIILEVAAGALEDGTRDPEKVFKVVDQVAGKASLVDNLRAYASRALYRVKGKSRAREEQFSENTHGASLVDSSHVERIEAQILVRELLDGLAPNDREIFVRLMNGQTCPEIDASLGLNPRTAEIRVAVCKNALRRAVQKKLNP